MIREGRVEANGLEFAYLEAGSGPLALCLHGFPDTPVTYRRLIPDLVQAGFRVVVPYLRGYAPTAIPADGDYSTTALVEDVLALHDVLGGDSDAVLVAHDWGAIFAWGATARAPERFRRAVICNIPPMQVYGTLAAAPAQIHRLFYAWFFQQHLAEVFVAAEDFAFLDYLWQQWSPGYDATEDLAAVKQALGNPAHLSAALGYYRTFGNPSRYFSPEWVAEQLPAWGGVPTHPTLYLHATQDGFCPLDDAHLAQIAALLGKDSQVAWIDNAGHFLLVEQPEQVNARIVRFLTTADVPTTGS